MKHRKLKLLFFVTIVSAILIVPVVAAPGGGGGGGGATYTVYGYVREPGTNNAISGASVVLYKVTEYGSYKVASKLTSSNGYYSFSTYQSSMPLAWQVQVSKTGYESNSKSVACRTTSTYMGTVYLTKMAPPYDPVIVVTSTEWRNSEFSLDWIVNWGTPIPGTSYGVELFWGEDSNFDGETSIESWSGSTTFYTYTIESLHRGDWWYKIEATAINYYGSGHDELVEPTLGIILPDADTFTQEDLPDTNFGSEPYLRAGCTYFWDQTRVYFKFTINNPAEVSSVSLLSYIESSEGHIGMAAHSVDPFSWTEQDLKWSNQPDYNPDSLDLDPNGGFNQWDCWDVTELARGSETFSVVLIFSGDRGDQAQFFEYSSREGTEATRPHLLVQYRSDNEVITYETDGLPLVENTIRSDEFEYDSLDTNLWTPEQIGSAPEEAYWCSGGSLGVGGPSLFGDPAGWAFSQPCNYNSGFQFESTVRIKLQASIPGPRNVPEYIKTGFYLNSIVNDEVVVIGEFYLVYIYDAFFYDMSLYPFWIYGRVGDTEESTCLTINTAHQMLGDIDTTLKIVRDPVTNHILLRYLNLPLEWPLVEREEVTLLETEFEGPIVSVHMMSEMHTTVPQMTFGFFNNFRQMPVQLIHQPTPHEGYNFEEPLRASGFNSYDSVRQVWLDNDGEETVGDFAPFCREGDMSWRVTESLGLHQFIMIQDVIETGLFNFDSLKEQIVGFSLYVCGDETVSMVRLEIGYENGGVWYECSSAWQIINDDDDMWYLLSVSTQYPLPKTMTKFEVRVVGIGYKNSYFSGYFDSAELTLLGMSFSEGRFGTVIMSSQVYFADRVDTDPLDIRSMPIATFKAAEGYYIDKVEMDVNIICSGGQVTGELSPDHFVESNNLKIDYIEPTLEDYQEWMHITSFLDHSARWVTRIGCYASGVGAPMSWFVGDFIGGTLDLLFLSERDPGGNTQVNANGGDYHANGDVDYPHPLPHVFSSEVGGRVYWRVYPADHVYNPIIQITFTVTWSDSVTWFDVGTTKVGLSLVCIL
ncbi:MAG: DNRLRE domain-containing protein [Candidatus Thorarchaeota archaeon]